MHAYVYAYVSLYVHMHLYVHSLVNVCWRVRMCGWAYVRHVQALARVWGLKC